MPGESGVTVVTTLVCFLLFTHEAAGASSARHSLRPLISEGGNSRQNSGAMRGEIAKLRLKMPRRHCEERSDKAIQNRFTRAMDCFVEPVIGRAFARPVGSQ
jgi:hypothetical protein